MPKFRVEWELVHYAHSFVEAKNKAEAKRKALAFNDFDYAELDEPKAMKVHGVEEVSATKERNRCGNKKTSKKGGEAVR